jgi:hypothetical protein
LCARPVAGGGEQWKRAAAKRLDGARAPAVLNLDGGMNLWPHDSPRGGVRSGADAFLQRHALA